MARTYPAITDELRRFIEAQQLFFVASAPLDASGHVNVSPKGLDTFRVLGPKQVAYLDLTGSGVETIAHIRENGRITIMLCAFTGPPRICRLYGRGTVHTLGSVEFDALAPEYPELPGARAIIDIAVTRISTSCGYAVPRMELVEERDNLTKWARKQGEDGLVEYRETRNAESIDGLAGYPVSRLSDHA